MRKLTVPVVVLAALALLALPAGATYPGVNGPITYSKNLEPGPEAGLHEIFKLDGGVETQLSDSTPPGATIPGIAVNSDWSPDGSRVAFDTATGPDALPDIAIVKADGTGQTRLTDNEWWDAFPNWSPDGRRIAFDSDGPNFPESQGIWSMRPDGTDVRRLTDPPGEDIDSEPAYSPDGRWLAFTRFRDTCKFPNRNRFVASACTSAIYVVRLDGTGMTRLTSWGSSVASPDWSPDGKRIAYHRCCDSGKQGQKLDVYVMNADGSGDTRLTKNAPWTGGPFVGSGNPVWSPDGRRLLFTQWFADRPFQIMVMNADGSNIEAVTSDPTASNNEADWGPSS
jgi:Tol biopolymer transport system component